MRIGFYAPLKAPDHPVPSGDRQMARSLMAALRVAGHEVELYARLRAFAPAPDAPSLATLQGEAARHATTTAAAWEDARVRPHLLFTYHLHYKAPDLLGPVLARQFALPYVTAEASLSGRRASGPWAPRQALVAAAVQVAALNLCFTARDRDGLRDTASPERLLDLPPFIDATPFAARVPAEGPVRIITIAMMRHGDKRDSYRILAEALRSLPSQDWRLTVVGDGPARAEVMAALGGLPPDRVRVMGAVASDAIPGLLRDADLLAWPGCNEAFGLCYLEAQAAGVPVIALRNAGTPSVVRDGETGLLTDPDAAAFAVGLGRLVGDAGLRARLGRAGARFVRDERSLAGAARRLDAALRPLVGEDGAR